MAKINQIIYACLILLKKAKILFLLDSSYTILNNLPENYDSMLNPV